MWWPVDSREPELVSEYGAMVMAARAAAGEAIDPRLLEPEDTLSADEKLKRFQDRYGQWAVTNTGMLDRFITIKTPAQVLRFAELYGVLDLCQHGLPASHNWSATTRGCYPVGWDTRVSWETLICREPIKRWLYYAAQFRAVLRLVLAVLQEKAGADEDWALAMADYVSDGEERETVLVASERRPMEHRVPGRASTGQRLLLAEIINDLLALGGVRPSIKWARDEKESSFQLSASTFGLMALQLALISSGSHRLAICDGCKEIYVRKRRLPRPSQHGYCEACSPTKANRQRQSSWRAKPGNRERENQRQRERRAKAPTAFEQHEQAREGDQPSHKQQEAEYGKARQ